jgi:hypothetical protein
MRDNRGHEIIIANGIACQSIMSFGNCAPEQPAVNTDRQFPGWMIRAARTIAREQGIRRPTQVEIREICMDWA